MKTSIQFDYHCFSLHFITASSCKDILAANESAISGTYQVNLAFNVSIEVYCDMETVGGGWTLVYSYTFTDYNDFALSKNAVTPRPNWPARLANVPISTTLSLSESLHGAVDWNLWKTIGREFMVKSNINDWIFCRPNIGSIFEMKNGSVTCQNIKNVAPHCDDVKPNRILWYPAGPSIEKTWTYYFFDGSKNANCPTHDPCGNNGYHHVKGVENPAGQIYIR